jgi:nitroreductase
MELLDAIYSRRAVRAFVEDDVIEAQIRTLIDAAIQAPSAVNRQPWVFTVVRDRALLARISREAKAHLLRTSPAALLSHHFDALLHDDAFDIFYHAPVLIVISANEDGPWATADCALAAQNLMLVARDANLGSCWIGFAQSWLGTPDGKAAIGLSPACVPVAPVIIGHPKPGEAGPVARKAPEVHWVG